MPSLWAVYPSDGPCPFHRVLQPVRFCAPAFARAGVTLACGSGIQPGHDFLMLHGLPTPDAVFELARQRRAGAKFVWGLDDDFLSIPDFSPAKLTPQGLATFDLTLAIADHVVVSTAAIARTLGGHPSVHVAPNLLDPGLFPVPPWEQMGGGTYSPAVELPVRVAWVGGHTHQGDTEVMAEGVSLALDRLGPDRLQVMFFGMMPPAALLTRHLHRGLMYHPPVTFDKYQRTLCAIQPHLYLAPLADIEFNESKSNLRVVEGFMLGAPAVASPVGEYAATVRAGVDGRFADTPEAWASAVVRLATDHQTRVQMGCDARARAVAAYNWRKAACRAAWVQAFAAILGIDPPPDEDTP